MKLKEKELWKQKTSWQKNLLMTIKPICQILLSHQTTIQVVNSDPFFVYFN